MLCISRSIAGCDSSASRGLVRQVQISSNKRSSSGPSGRVRSGWSSMAPVDKNVVSVMNENTTNSSHSLFAFPESRHDNVAKHPEFPHEKSRKQARSARTQLTPFSTQLFRFWRREGAQRFTAARVAEKAGVSIGSLYQYFPNKAAILFRLQSDEWRQTTDLLQQHSSEYRQAAARKTARPSFTPSFARSAKKPPFAAHLDDAAPLYRDAPEAQEAQAMGDSVMQNLTNEALPKTTKAARDAASDLILTTLSLVGKRILGNATNLNRDRILCRCYGRYVLRFISESSNAAE